MYYISYHNISYPSMNVKIREEIHTKSALHISKLNVLNTVYQKVQCWSDVWCLLCVFWVTAQQISSSHSRPSNVKIHFSLLPLEWRYYGWGDDSCINYAYGERHLCKSESPHGQQQNKWKCSFQNWWVQVLIREQKFSSKSLNVQQGRDTSFDTCWLAVSQLSHNCV